MTNDLIERLNMIVAELQGLPHVVQSCREAAAHIEALAERVRELEEAIDAFATDFIMAHDASPPDSHLRLVAFRSAVRDLCVARQARKDKENDAPTSL